jgi:RNA polymerase-binding transcription factor DksA
MNGEVHDPDHLAVLQGARRSALDRVRTVREEFEGLAGDADEANGDDEHDPEGSTLAYERARVAALLADAESTLRELDQALARLAAGDYARCEGCGGPIAPERLEALPATRTCIDCAMPRPGRGP